MKVMPYMQTAELWAKQSHCIKRQVGACLFNNKTGQLLSIGYNGTIRGFEVNCNQLFFSKEGTYGVHGNIINYLDIDTEDLPFPYSWNSVPEFLFRKLHKMFAEQYEVHAEQNAIYNLLKSSVDLNGQLEDLVLCVTLEPCIQCAKAIIGLGIKHVVYKESHESSHSQVSLLFEKANVKYEQYKES